MTQSQDEDATCEHSDGPLIVNNGDEDQQSSSNLEPVVVGSSSLLTNSSRSGDDLGTGWFGSSLLIVNAALGAGLLNFPAAFHEAGGVVTGVAVQIFLLCFIIPALLILAYCSDWDGSKTLQEVLAFTWGRKAEKITSFCVALYCFGTCITFLIIIGDQFDRSNHNN